MTESNPYEPPSETTPMKQASSSTLRQHLLFLTLILLAIPSSLIAGFTTCVLVFNAGYVKPGMKYVPVSNTHGLSLSVGGVTVVVVFGLFIYAIYRVNRSMVKKFNENTNNDSS